jgi:MtN3 and saliva related transmembrane protein
LNRKGLTREEIGGLKNTTLRLRNPELKTKEVVKKHHMNWIEAFGHIGAFLTAVTFIPQVYKIWKTKSATDLSLTMILIILMSTIVWLVYAVALMLWPVIIANSIVFLLDLMLLYFKFAYGKKG